MNILIRCDSSNIIGTGHVMRCLNLCEYYPENSYTFVCKNFKSNITQKIIDASHNLILLDYLIEPQLNKYNTWIGCDVDTETAHLVQIATSNKYDQIIIDHYGIDWIIEKELGNYTSKLTVISDIFNSSHWCDEFINYNSDNLELLQSLNLKPNTAIKYGVENIIINKIFKQNQRITFRPKIEKIGIMLGGSDPFNYTLKILEKIDQFIQEQKIEVYIVIGKANTNINSINNFITNKTNYHCLFDLKYNELVKFYYLIDLCIGSLSITAYERYFMKVPQICLKIVDNQNIQQLEEFNICSINNLDLQINKLFFQ